MLNLFIGYSSLLEVNSLNTKISYVFQNRDLLKLALTHKSYANEQGGPKASHNERLEFLGDAILGAAIADLLYDRLPQAAEGMLSRIRAQLVRAETLAAIARDLDLGPILLLGKGELATGGQTKDSILSSALEALIGAIYMDTGFIAAKSAVLEYFTDRLDAACIAENRSDYKTMLQELAQNLYRRSPEYLVVDELGPDHEKIFEVKVSILGKERFGKGKNKKEAEQNAAKFLIDHLQTETLRHGAEKQI